MKTGGHRYKYHKQIGGRGRYGEIELEINLIESNSVVIDECTWETLRQSYPDFKELGILKIWKQSAIEAAESILQNYFFPNNIELKIKDVVGNYADTVPSYIGAAVTIGIFNLLESPLGPDDIRIVDDFVTCNSGLELIPNYRNLVLTKPKRPSFLSQCPDS